MAPYFQFSQRSSTGALHVVTSEHVCWARIPAVCRRVRPCAPHGEARGGSARFGSSAAIKVFPCLIDAVREATRIPGSSHLFCHLPDRQHVSAPRPPVAATRHDTLLDARAKCSNYILIAACDHM